MKKWNKKGITKEALQAGLNDDQWRCAKVTWLNNFKPWEHIQRTSSRAEEKELLNLKDALGFQASRTTLHQVQ